MSKELFERRFQRERKARKQAEQILESKSLELYQSNLALQDLANNLEQKIAERTVELEKEKTRALQLSQAKSNFVATMSHEIRTPINGISGALQLLVSEVNTDEAHHLIDIANHSAEILIHIINDVLDFSKIEAGQMQLENIAFDLKKLCENAINANQEAAKRKGNELLFHWDNNAPIWQSGDPYRITQILNNYLSNAIKFTSDGRVILKVKPESDAIHLNVVDTGIGIPETSLHKLFNDFSQVDSSTTREYGGTGLGLAICKKLAALMQGSVNVNSTVGVGSEFNLTLPNKPTETPPSQNETVQITHQLEQDTCNILLVDDNLINRKIGSKILEKMGHNVTLAEQGIEALEFIKNTDYDFDIVLMDCQMPEMDGFEATRKAREMGCQTPIIALTANTSEEDRQQALNSGMNEFLSKPFKANEIQAIILQFTQNKTV